MALDTYNDFVQALLDAGFSMGGSNASGIFAVIPFGWRDLPLDSKIRWHSGDPEVDPWEWRIRVLDERNDIAYAKVFFRKSGFITQNWYPYFLAVRRRGLSFEEAYRRGSLSHMAQRIYNIAREHDSVPVHEIKRIGGFNRSENTAFESAILELQMTLHLTICGRKQKTSQLGEEYGWASSVFCTTERFWGDKMFEQAEELDPTEAEETIAARILKLNPAADRKKMIKFIRG